MLHLANTLHRLLVPVLIGGASLITLLFVIVLVQRGVRELAYRRQQRLRARYKPLVDALLAHSPSPSVRRALLGVPRRHRVLVEPLLLGPLRVVTGELVDRAREALDALGSTARWRALLTDRRWWRRAEGARALGLVRDPHARAALGTLLDDPHDDVRAAAVEALGHLGDPDAVPLLLSRLEDQTRHQSARIVEALRAFGPPVTPALLAYGERHPEALGMLIDLIALIGSPAAVPDLLVWSDDTRPDIRAKAMTALGALGLDERAYYYALRALEDEAPAVRAAAGRALGRSGRSDATAALARHLDDDWLVAANCASALKRLGEAGRAELQRRQHGDSQAADLARQMLWTPDRTTQEQDHSGAAVAS